MKKRQAKRDSRFAAAEAADLTELRDAIEYDEFEDAEPELDWVAAYEDNCQAEPDDDFNTIEEELEPTGEDEDDFDIVAHYFRESACHKLLSPAQERLLTEAVKRGSIARRRMARSRSLTAATLRKLAATIEQADCAREDLVRLNARLVISIARHYQNLGLPLLDLIQEGNIGLLRAIDRFEPARGLRLSTYATWWVRQAINRAVANQGRTIRLPAYLQDRLYKLQRATQDLEQRLGRTPDDEELANSLAVAPKEIHLLRAASGTVASLDEPLNNEDDESPLAQIEDLTVVPLDELAARRLLHEAIERALDELPARYALILRMRYGIDGDQPRTLEYIAQKLALSRERVRQIERDARTRLRLHQDIRKQVNPSNISVDC